MLSGTPIQNHLLEMWNIMDWVSDHRLLGDRHYFISRYKRPIEEGQQRNATEEQRVYAQYMATELRKLIFSITLRREKSIVLNSNENLHLGKKTEIVLWWYSLRVYFK